MGPFFTSSSGGKLAEHYRDLGAPEPYTWDRVIRYLMGEFGNYGGAPMDFYKAKATVWKNKYWHRFIRRNRGSREEHRQRLLEWEMAYHKDPPKGKRSWWLAETTVAFDNLLKPLIVALRAAERRAAHPRPGRRPILAKRLLRAIQL